MWFGLMFLVVAASAQKLGNQRGGIQSLKSVPLPPRDYVSPSYLRQQSEPPKPFSYKYEGPDPYGGYSSHESTGDERGRITGQYTVQNPDGSSRLVRYVADPETGFHAEVETDEEGTKTSEPANASIISTAPEETYQPQSKTNDYGSGRKPAPARGAYRAPQNTRPRYNAPRAPAPFANTAYRAQQSAYRAPARQSDSGLNRGLQTRRNTGLYQQARNLNALPASYNNYQQTRPGAYRGSSQGAALNQHRTFSNPSLDYKYNVNAASRGAQSRFGTSRPNYTSNRQYTPNSSKLDAYAGSQSNQYRFSG